MFTTAADEQPPREAEVDIAPEDSEEEHMAMDSQSVYLCVFEAAARGLGLIDLGAASSLVGQRRSPGYKASWKRRPVEKAWWTTVAHDIASAT